MTTAPDQHDAKLSETLEIRLSYAQKRAFMRHCAAAGVTASQALRAEIARSLQEGPAARPGERKGKTMTLTSMTLAAALSAGLLMQSAPDARFWEIFERADRNGDGALSMAEVLTDIERRAAQVSPQELLERRAAAERAAAAGDLEQSQRHDQAGALCINCFGAAPPDLFASRDIDGDGLITRAEFAAAPH